MELVITIVNIFVHLDQYLTEIIQSYGSWTYLLLFIVIFCETGLVVTPFLPGDSLLFAAGALAALGGLQLEWLVGLLILSAIAGDTVNYWAGNYIGPRAFSGHIRYLKKSILTAPILFTPNTVVKPSSWLALSLLSAPLPRLWPALERWLIAASLPITFWGEYCGCYCLPWPVISLATCLLLNIISR